MNSFVAVCKEKLQPGVFRNKARTNGSLTRHQRTWKLQKLTRTLSFCLLILVFLICCGWLSLSLLGRSDIFRVTDLIVRGNTMATQQQIMELGGLNSRINLLTLDTDQVESLVLEHPWIDQVTVNRLWPSTVEVVVREHTPLALINLEQGDGKHLFYVDRKGVIFTPSTPSIDLDYPVLTGESIEQVVYGMKVAENSLAGKAIEFLNLTAQGNQILPAQAVSEVHVSPEKGLIVYLVDHPFPIYLGKEKIKTRFNLLVQVLAQLYRQDKVKEVTEIRMDYAEDKILVANIEK
ncbi:MAG: cell division protein FtsQ/DivIB [Desulfobulbales bacterium]